MASRLVPIIQYPDVKDPRAELIGHALKEDLAYSQIMSKISISQMCCLNSFIIVVANNVKP